MSNLEQIDAVKIANTGGVLFDWLGTFWTRTFSNPELAKQFAAGQAMLLAQQYIDFLESLDLCDHANVPVFHRERWLPTLIRKSGADKGTSSLIRIGMDVPPKIGPQDYNTPFTPGAVFEIGGVAAYENVVSYPVPGGIADVLTAIVDDPIKPNVMLVRDRDFVVEQDTIYFLRQSDPFLAGVFPVRATVDEAGQPDYEAMLWLCDATIDRDYLFNHLGYVIGDRTKSSEFYKRLLSGIWRLYNLGTPFKEFVGAIGAMFGEPVVLTDGEVVKTIHAHDGAVFVATDRNVYKTSAAATLRVRVDDVLRAGEFLTESLRTYTNIDVMALHRQPFGLRLKQDLQTLFLPKSMVRTALQYGLGLSWEPADIVLHEITSAGCPHLKTTIYGTDADVNAFWQAYWDHLDAQGYTSDPCFAAYMYDTLHPTSGSVWGKVAPLEFFFRYCLGAHAFVIAVDSGRLAESVPPDTAIILSALRAVLPAHLLLVIVEWRDLSDTYNLTDNVTDTSAVAWSTNLTSTCARASKIAPKSGAALTYRVSEPTVRWIPTCT